MAPSRGSQEREEEAVHCEAIKAAIVQQLGASILSYDGKVRQDAATGPGAALGGRAGGDNGLPWALRLA